MYGVALATARVTVKVLIVWMLVLLGVAQAQGQALVPNQGVVDGLRLRVDAGATCLERDRLAARIQRWREHAELDHALRVHVVGDPHDPTIVSFSVERADGPRSERVLRNAPADCDQLHSAVALSIALAVDASFAAHGARALPLEAAETRRVEPPSDRQKSESYRLDLALFGGASVGLLPGTALLLMPRLELSLRPWLSVVIEGLGSFIEHRKIIDTPGDFDAKVWAGGVDGCVGGAAAPSLSFFMCAGLRGGVFATHGDYFTTRDATTAWWAIAVSGQVRVWIVPNFGLGLAIGGSFTLADRNLVVMSTDEMSLRGLAMPRLGLFVAGGPLFRFF